MSGIIVIAWLAVVFAPTCYLLGYRRGRSHGWVAYRRMRWEEAERAGLPTPPHEEWETDPRPGKRLA